MRLSVLMGGLLAAGLLSGTAHATDSFECDIDTGLDKGGRPCKVIILIEDKAPLPKAPKKSTPPYGGGHFSLGFNGLLEQGENDSTAKGVSASIIGSYSGLGINSSAHTASGHGMYDVGTTLEFNVISSSGDAEKKSKAGTSILFNGNTLIGVSVGTDSSLYLYAGVGANLTVMGAEDGCNYS